MTPQKVLFFSQWNLRHFLVLGHIWWNICFLLVLLFDNRYQHIPSIVVSCSRGVFPVVLLWLGVHNCREGREMDGDGVYFSICVLVYDMHFFFWGGGWWGDGWWLGGPETVHLCHLWMYECMCLWSACRVFNEMMWNAMSRNLMDVWMYGCRFVCVCVHGLYCFSLHRVWWNKR